MSNESNFGSLQLSVPSPDICKCCPFVSVRHFLGTHIRYTGHPPCNCIYQTVGLLAVAIDSPGPVHTMTPHPAAWPVPVESLWQSSAAYPMELDFNNHIATSEISGIVTQYPNHTGRRLSGAICTFTCLSLHCSNALIHPICS